MDFSKKKSLCLKKNKDLDRLDRKGRETEKDRNRQKDQVLREYLGNFASFPQFLTFTTKPDG